MYAEFFEAAPSALNAFHDPYVAPAHNVAHIALAHDQVLLKVEAVAHDPVDWHRIDDITHETSHSARGADFSGVVVGRGPSVGAIALGDHIVAFVPAAALRRAVCTDDSKDDMHSNLRNMVYVRVDADLAWVVPKGTFSHEAAANSRLARYRYLFGIPSR